MPAEKIKVLIVDDSAIVRGILLETLEKESDIEVVGTAPDPYVARSKILQHQPDVITLDIEMPRMNGLDFLQKLMEYYPIPVIIVSSVTSKDAFAAVKALEFGAFDVVNKPGGSISVEEVIGDILFKIRQAFQVRHIYTSRRELVQKSLQTRPVTRIDSNVLSQISTTDQLVAIGASTGGTVALEYILTRLPANFPPVLITQHMPPLFTTQFAQRLNELSTLNVIEAQGDELLVPGTVYIAPGGYHLILYRKGAMLYTQLQGGNRVNFQKPAVDVMFMSIAVEVGKNCVAAILTGMGKDGAQGLLKLKEKGAWTIAQDEKSSIVWGMPKAAVELNAHQEISSLEDFPNRLTEAVKKRLG